MPVRQAFVQPKLFDRPRAVRAAEAVTTAEAEAMARAAEMLFGRLRMMPREQLEAVVRETRELDPALADCLLAVRRVMR